MESAPSSLLRATLIVSLAGCDNGPAVEARPQTITFSTLATPAVDQTSLVVSATSTSGLPVRYSSLTPSLCSVNPDSGLVTALSSGTCTVAADQAGDARYAPAPQAIQDLAFTLTRETLAWVQTPPLGVFDRATVVAIASNGARVTYASLSPATCAIDGITGLVDALAPGQCTLSASAGGLQVSQVLTIAPAAVPTVPGMPTAITVNATDRADVAVVHVGAIASGGAPLSGYLVDSSPSGITSTAATSPIALICPTTCAGFAFSVSAKNALGTGLPSSFVDMVTDYHVVAVFHEPSTQPNDTLFVGAFTLDATTGTVSKLHGRLSEAMTGGSSPYPDDSMTWLDLGYQLSAVATTIDGVAGVLVTTFRLPSTGTLSSSPALGGTDGWSPGTGMGRYQGYPGDNPGNAYARIFVAPTDPTAPATQAQIDTLAYADCSPGGMMGAACMTGTAQAGYGTAGTMGGYPSAQTVTVMSGP